MIRIAMLSFWHVHAKDYAQQVAEHRDTRIVARMRSMNMTQSTRSRNHHLDSDVGQNVAEHDANVARAERAGGADVIELLEDQHLSAHEPLVADPAEEGPGVRSAVPLLNDECHWRKAPSPPESI
jgi:hypothetical protein